MVGRLWEGAESEEDRIAREVAAGLRTSVPLDPAAIIPLVAQVDDAGAVCAILFDSHPDIVNEAGMVVLPGREDGLAIGAPLPWPRAHRNAMLAACDWTEARSDKPAEWRAAWAAYRTALRDLPETCPDATAITWPEAPAA